MASQKPILEFNFTNFGCCHTGGSMAFDFAGNLFPLVNGQPRAKTRPEIYTMGHRNPYTISLDPYRNWVTWGDIGPDEGLQSEEHNLVTKPGFMGWPYFYGANQKFRGTTGIAAADMDLNKPLNKKWIFSDFNSGNLRVATPSEDGKTLVDDIEFYAGGFMSRPLDLEVGPEGALYLLENDSWFTAGTKTNISRLEYKGNCSAPQLVPPTIPSAVRDAERLNGLGRGELVAADLRRGLLSLPEGTCPTAASRIFAGAGPHAKAS